eukprot:CAMPEP_0178378874 /NCGR_PEP_ID=MMETSP0689_2-20121128/4651_1 /TAXON_ID=160604 /ORGANISM="Amphidinium massartii, Strain CS-259" /LENGTH=205 /DNA_ID=CAMNT_0019998957 /DNA_START=80 /DNA_END=698 /DNA_ORIENTATION=+
MPSSGDPSRSSRQAWPQVPQGGGGPSAGPRKGKRAKKSTAKVLPPEVELADFGLNGELEGSMYARLLVSRLSDANALSRRWAAEALGCIGPAAHLQVAPLTKVLYEDVDDRTRSAAGTALIRIQGKSVPPAVLAADAAARAVAQQCGRKVQEPLEEREAALDGGHHLRHRVRGVPVVDGGDEGACCIRVAIGCNVGCHSQEPEED